jgi:hypothetical protein
MAAAPASAALLVSSGRSVVVDIVASGCPQIMRVSSSATGAGAAELMVAGFALGIPCVDLTVPGNP